MNQNPNNNPNGNYNQNVNYNPNANYTYKNDPSIPPYLSLIHI